MPIIRIPNVFEAMSWKTIKRLALNDGSTIDRNSSWEEKNEPFEMASKNEKLYLFVEKLFFSVS